ncbi:MAG: hypothetical protein HZB61_10375 [Nitrospirae bacterium]|nr:hypothetical protein [Nitrospirota bacterium]
MAEVKITIIGEDKATPAFNTIQNASKTAFESVSNSATSAGDKINRFEAAVDKVKSSWLSYVGIVTATIGPIIALVKHTADTGEELLKTSKQIGISVEQLSGLKFAAEQSETDLASLTMGVKFLNKALTGMNEEGTDTSQTLATLGITAKDPYEALLQAADAFKNMAAGADKTTYAMQLFGRGGLEMIPILNEGSAGIKSLHQEAERLGIVFTTSAAQAADQFNDNLNVLKKNIAGVTEHIGNWLIPKLNDLFAIITDGAPSLDMIEKKIGNIQTILEGKGVIGSIWSGLFLLDAEKAKLQSDLESLLAMKDKLINDAKNTETVSPVKIDIEQYKKDFTDLVKLHGSAVSQMIEKDKELQQIESAIRQTRISTSDMVLQIEQKRMSASEKYYSTVNDLEKKYNQAMALSGDEKIKMLENVQRGWVGISDEVKEGEKVVVDATTAESAAMDRIKGLGDEIAKTYNQQQTEVLEVRNAWDEVRQHATSTLEDIRSAIQTLPVDQEFRLEVESAMSSIREVDSAMSMDATKKLNVDAAQAYAAIQSVKAGLDSVHDKTVTLTVKTMLSASPAQPFTQGVSYVTDKLNSLPKETDHTVKVNWEPGNSIGFGVGYDGNVENKVARSGNSLSAMGDSAITPTSADALADFYQPVSGGAGGGNYDPLDLAKWIGYLQSWRNSASDLGAFNARLNPLLDLQRQASQAAIDAHKMSKLQYQQLWDEMHPRLKLEAAIGGSKVPMYDSASGLSIFERFNLQSPEGVKAFMKENRWVNSNVLDQIITQARGGSNAQGTGTGSTGGTGNTYTYNITNHNTFNIKTEGMDANDVAREVDRILTDQSRYSRSEYSQDNDIQGRPIGLPT